MDIAVRQVNSLDTNYDMALKYHTYTVLLFLQFIILL